MSTDPTIVIPPTDMRLELPGPVGNTVTVRVDVLESQLQIDDLVQADDNMRSVCFRYGRWFSEQYDVQLTIGQAYAVIHKTREAFELFKKKLAGGPTSPSTTDSTPEA